MSINNIKIFRDSGKVDIDLVEDFERENNILFPENYKKFICEHNAAYPNNEYFDFFSPRQNAMDTTNICFLGFGSAEGLVIESQDIINNQNYDIYGYDDLITFGSNGGGDYICFDYRDCGKQGEPKIIFMLHDEYDDNTNKMITYDVAQSFDDFCKLLYQEGWDDE